MGIRFTVPVAGTNLKRLAELLAESGIHSSLTDPSSHTLRAFVRAESAIGARQMVEFALDGEDASIGRATGA
jgi:hypothetical protein